MNSELLESIKHHLQQYTTIKLAFKVDERYYVTKTFIETPVKFNDGYPVYKGVARLGHRDIFRVMVTEEFVAAVRYVFPVEHTKSEYDYYRIRDMLHRYMYYKQLDLVDPSNAALEGLFKFISEKKDLPNLKYMQEDISDELDNKLCVDVLKTRIAVDYMNRNDGYVSEYVDPVRVMVDLLSLN